MDDSDKKLLKTSAMVVLDKAVDGVDAYWQQQTGLPAQPFGTCWGLVKAVIGSVIARRTAKAQEIVEMVDEHKNIFTPEVLSDEEFQDGFVYEVERYLLERNGEKRRIAKNILMGFANAQDKNNFPLEKMSHTLSQLSELDIQTLRDVKIDEHGKNYQIYGESPNRAENVYNLVGAGILFDTTGSRIGHDPQNAPFVELSMFGKEFIKYILDEEKQN